jgi:putative phage-type endonuclease
MPNDRKTYIGGSDAAAISGVSPWKTPLQVWLEKTGELEGADIGSIPAVHWGTVLEAVCAREYAELTGCKLRKGKFTTHPKYPFIGGTPDRLVVGQRKLLEIKTTNAWSGQHDWGEVGTDAIPLPYLLQVSHYLALLDYDVADVAVLIGGSDFRIYTVRRDLELEEMLIDRERRFWEDYVVPRVQPPLDGSAAAKAYLTRRFPRALLDLRPATPDETAKLDLYMQLCEKMKEIDEKMALADNEVRAMIGDAKGIETPAGRFFWSEVKGTEGVDWKGLAEELFGHVKFKALKDGLLKKYTKMLRPPTRRLSKPRTWDSTKLLLEGSGNGK